jgi:hypothetical protein
MIADVKVGFDEDHPAAESGGSNDLWQQIR